MSGLSGAFQAGHPDASGLPRTVSSVDIALILAAIAVALPFLIEWLKRPRLEAKVEGHWLGRTPTPWTFAHVWIRNRPLPPIIRGVLVRESATACTATVEFSKGGERVLPEIPARWSSRPEPTKVELEPLTEGPAASAAGTGAAVMAGTPEVHQNVIVRYEPSMVPQSLTNDLAPGRWEEVAVAILFDDGEAFAWGAESYAAGGRRTDWRLDRGEYNVAIRVESSGLRKTLRFKLDNLAADFSRFGLKRP